MSDNAAALAPPSTRGGPDPRAGGRNMAMGSRRHHQHDAAQVQWNRGNRGGRGERGRRGRRRAGLNDSNCTSDTQPGLHNGLRSDRGPRNDGVHDTLSPEAAIVAARSRQGDTDVDQPTEEGEVCFICTSTIDHLSITPCNHQTCHICALRLRALYKKRDCAYCKSEAPYVIFTDDLAKRYEDFAGTDFVRLDESLGIKYEKAVILEDTVLLLRYNCPDRDCDIACLGWPHLHNHVKQKHGKLMCDLCTRNKKVFTHEHELFTFSELRRHEKLGDDRSGAINQSGFKGHPECGFCRQRFYGDDELYEHCREKHERCHICDRRNPGSQVQYYLNYQMLEKHFQADHFVCLDDECQENKTNVFESEMDLKAHQLSSHPNGLSKDARRDARLVNISGFDYRAPYHPQRRDRDHRGNGRGPDPNVEALPISSAQPLRRDELAYQRQMAIINAQPRPQPQLIPRNHAASPVPRSSRPAVPANAVPDLSTLSLDASPSPTPGDHHLNPQEQARRIRHTSVLQRASNLLQAETTRLTTFRNHVSSYTSSSIDAGELVDSFFSLFDVSSAELGKLVRELADIYEDETKRQDLLKAWNDWLSINADYPSLPGPTGILSGTSTGGSTGGNNHNNSNNEIRPSGRRVLRLKSSTAQSSRSEVSRQSGWGNAVPSNENDLSSSSSTSAATQSSPFPPLAPPSSLSNGQPRTPWTNSIHPTSSTTTTTKTRTGAPASTPTSTSTSHSTKPANNNNSSSNNPRPRSTTRSTKPNDDMFPALPSGKKPNTLMAGLTRGTVRWDDGTAADVGNPWSRGGGAGPGTEGPVDGDFGAGAGGARKAGKKGKQVLYKFG